MSDSTWMSADPHLASSLSPSQDERMRSPQNLHSQEDVHHLSHLSQGLNIICSLGTSLGARTPRVSAERNDFSFRGKSRCATSNSLAKDSY
ncbi:LOW QUALITY PROTEIN: NOL4L isoform 7 [Pongo abelii]|uniref:NOL4L isoform 7 n=1 Tax=Pongo abelii TaxID=9601 RepID=A0A2J8VIN7_PONAB|nr:LOW QUALITY PROTEIN: NOL4L isoform 7 [Pongo abelii]